MRKGKNPILTKKINKKSGYHRILIPVYIPDLNGYYSNSFEVLKLCISSLLSTVHEKSLITIIDNNCCLEVKNYLNDLVRNRKVNQIIVNSENNGKIDPIVSILKGTHENLITITDADVLFASGWQSEVEKLFIDFPEAGMVSPLGIPSFYSYFSAYSWFYGILKYKIVREYNDDLSSVIKFNESIGRHRSINSIESNPIYIKNGNSRAMLGNGHFCVTISKEVIPYIPLKLSGSQFKGAEVNFIDYPVVLAGFMRIATPMGHVYHMGNVSEQWMYELLNENKCNINYFNIPPRKKSMFVYLFGGFLRKIFLNSSFLKFLVKHIYKL
ncbi:glycosyltransferase family A protein [Algoriphagus sp. D3-2-R+10]|uniref:glycosyltransferase family A protein n=1 Tax=Algoriphagus aurantiacus TaxID=3103948 RepID=UPI002B3B53DD|nr:glycosyltransferase family A protein [Algoriphagus sp. D3-2-R+10]MEB2777516.1 glycosyltransferase family A protein [Algoriphagus sp. D3-2-R+10]